MDVAIVTSVIGWSSPILIKPFHDCHLYILKMGLRSGKPEAYQVSMDPKAYSVLNIMLYSVTHETSNYDLELVKKLFTILTDQVIGSTVFSHSCIQFFLFVRKKKEQPTPFGPLERKKVQCIGFAFKVYLLYTGYHFFLSALLTSWQESAELLWLCFWCPAASSPLLSDSNIIKYIFRLCKAHQIQIKLGFCFFLKPQIFYNERFYLLKLCAKSWRVHTRGYWLIRRWITEDLSVWYTTVTLLVIST